MGREERVFFFFFFFFLFGISIGISLQIVNCIFFYSSKSAPILQRLSRVLAYQKTHDMASVRSNLSI